MSLVRWGLFVLFFPNTVALAAMAISQADGQAPLWGPAAATAAITAALGFWATGPMRAARRSEAIVTARQVEQASILANLPAPEAVDIGSAMLQAEESPVYSERSEMVEITAGRTATGVGTRLNIGSLPIAVGRSEAQRVDRATSAGAGLLLLTSNRLMFVGERAQFSAHLAELTSVQNGVLSITVSVARRQRPVMFATNNGFVWDKLIRDTRARNS